MATPKQQKLIKLLLDNLGKMKVTKTLGEMILEAGYTKNMADNPYQILESETIQEGISDFVRMLDDKRRLSLVKITEKKLEEASARDNAYVVDMLTKQHQLLTGGVTDNVKASVEISETIFNKYNLNNNTPGEKERSEPTPLQVTDSSIQQ